MTSRPRILYMSPCLPTELTYGSPLRVQQIASALSAIGQLDYVALSWGEFKLSPNPGRGQAITVRRVIDMIHMPPRGWRDRLRCSLDSRFLGYHGKTVAPEDKDFILNELGNYDLVWLHHIRTADMFGRWHWPASIMDLDDVPSTFLRTMLQQPGVSAEHRLRTRVQRRIARQRERLLLERFSALTVCSEEDRRYLGLAERVHVVPNGFTRPDRPPERRPATPPRVGYVGTLGYPPNVDGVEWFVRECWPQIRRLVPGVRLRLVGKLTDELFKSGFDGVDAFGWVADPASEMATWSMMVVPVRMGAGTRVKIADGFSRQCPIVSTRLGAFGYDVENGRELMLADSAGDFADACVRVLRDPAEADRMAQRGWERFLERWTWDALAPRVHAAVEDALRGRARRAVGLGTAARSRLAGEAAE